MNTSQDSASGRWFITPHAVARYRERICPGASYEQALRDLIAWSERAHFVREQNGSQLWRGPRPGKLRFWVSFGRHGLPQLVTVLPAHDKKGPPRLSEGGLR